MLLLNKFPNVSDVALHSLSALNDCEKRPYRVLISKFQNQLLEDALAGFSLPGYCGAATVTVSVVQSSLFAQTIGTLLQEQW